MLLMRSDCMQKEEMTFNAKQTIKPRTPLADHDLVRLTEMLDKKSISQLAREARLPYMLVYNVAHGRVKTVSEKHYRMLFRRPPPSRQPEKVDGGSFRKLARLWLFLNDDLPKSALFRELYGRYHSQKPDLRIFSGQIQTVDSRLDRIMRQKFTVAGVDEPLLNQWLDELDELPDSNWVSYDRIRPVLQFLQDHLGVHPTAILNQTVARYESGFLKRVSRDIFNHAMTLKHETKKALETGDVHKIDRLKDSISGGKTGYTRYSEVEEELYFLRIHMKKSSHSYLGRSRWVYETGKVKRLADWRARKIQSDCERFVRERTDLPLSVLPRSWRRRRTRMLFDVLNARVAQLLSRQDGIVLEKRILRPLHRLNEYKNRHYGLTQFDMAPSVLGMKRKAFDLMVANNCDIFRAVGTYSKRWYLSDLYLKELTHNRLFGLVSAKYESISKNLIPTKQPSYCMN